jgi:hypothetical protein
MRKQFFDTNVIVAHQDYPCQIWHDPPTATTTQKYTLHTLCIWGWVVDMVNNNVDRNYWKFKYLPHLTFKIFKIHLHEISLVKGFFNITKELALIFLLKIINFFEKIFNDSCTISLNTFKSLWCTSACQGLSNGI